MKVDCSSGTYIRKLGEEIAQALGTVGHLTTLKRTRIGDYIWTSALQFSELDNLKIAEIDGVA
jgi:tRNA pseudouridine55 synthase